MRLPPPRVVGEGTWTLLRRLRPCTTTTLPPSLSPQWPVPAIKCNTTAGDIRVVISTWKLIFEKVEPNPRTPPRLSTHTFAVVMSVVVDLSQGTSRVTGEARLVVVRRAAPAKVVGAAAWVHTTRRHRNGCTLTVLQVARAEANAARCKHDTGTGFRSGDPLSTPLLATTAGHRTRTPFRPSDLSIRRWYAGAATAIAARDSLEASAGVFLLLHCPKIARKAVAGRLV